MRFSKNRSALGVAGDLGIHKVDLLRYLLQEEIVQVSALTAVLDKKDEEGLPIEVCDHMVRLLRTHWSQLQQEKGFLCNKIVDDCDVAWSH
ncbi:hypothetical protein ACFYU8_05250 [Brevibacillus sp. NPDC003359]|uniref:Gfo/Idh/MocA family protein n=1 Tax=unclassified Brevibacillus TaxID=2684853 RepID=UPI0036B838C6